MIPHESISAAADGEDLSSSLIRGIASDADARREWETDQLIGALLRKETPASLSRGFMDRFEARFASEPVLMTRPERKTRRFAGVLRYFGQAAIAASVAALAVTGVNYYSVNGAGSVDQVLNTTPYGGIASPVRANIRSTPSSIEVLPQSGYSLPENTRDRDLTPDFVQPGKISNHELAQIEALLQDHALQSRMQRSSGN